MADNAITRRDAIKTAGILMAGLAIGEAPLSPALQPRPSACPAGPRGEVIYGCAG